jgi:hypothetical protein
MLSPSFTSKDAYAHTLLKHEFPSSGPNLFVELLSFNPKYLPFPLLDCDMVIDLCLSINAQLAPPTSTPSYSLNFPHTALFPSFICGLSKKPTIFADRL